MREVSTYRKTRNRLNEESLSTLTKYQDEVVGKRGKVALVYHEIVVSCFGNFPGGFGYVLRSIFYKRLLRLMGKGVILGKDINLRCPNRIQLGNRVAADGGCLIDARGGGEIGIIIGEDVIIGRHSAIQAKNGSIQIGKKTNIGPQCVISANNSVTLGEELLIGAFCYIGGGLYHSERTDIPMVRQGMYSKGPLIIEDDVWLGAGSIVLDGIHVGRGCIVGAGSVVTRNLPEYSVAVGTPAKVIRERNIRL